MNAPTRIRAVIFGLFLVSGFCGLLYEIVWLRLAMLHFGVIGPVVSVVVSVFMAGLGIGSLLGGRYVSGIAALIRKPPLFVYAAAEALIALGAFAVPLSFEAGARLLLHQSASDSFGYLLASAAIIFASILPWAGLMGTTFPFMVAGVGQRFSFLYLANVLGGAAGALVTAFVLVELLGFETTLALAAALNVAIALTAGWLATRSGAAALDGDEPAGASAGMAPRADERSRAWTLLPALFASGFCSMGMEVAWNRCFVAPLGGTVYAFAIILAIYLAATFAGTAHYRRRRAPTAIAGRLPRILAWSGLCGLLPPLLGDLRLGLPPLVVALSISPICALLGYLTPAIVDEYASLRPDRVGLAYGVNVAGCIAGPLVTSYLLLTRLPEHAALALLALVFTAFAVVTCKRLAESDTLLLFLTGLAAVLAIFSAVLPTDGPAGVRKLVKHDYAATVTAFGEGFDKFLMVNGFSMTHMTTITKLMAHLPLALHEPKPGSALIICFGMGTTYRSALSWGLKTDVVELAPSVPDVFEYYHGDAATVRRDPNGSIIIDDGRRYLARTKNTYDVIIIDPPPPVDAAASGMLYSTEFYRLVRAHLNEGGLFQQWLPDTSDRRLVGAVLRSLHNVFPELQMLLSIEGWGFHFLASAQPIGMPPLESLAARFPGEARRDLVEWTGQERFESVLKRALAKPASPSEYLEASAVDEVTDDQPFNEYHFLRDHFGL